MCAGVSKGRQPPESCARQVPRARVALRNREDHCRPTFYTEVFVSRKAPTVTVSSRAREVVSGLSRSRKQPQRLVERATIILFAVDGLSDAEIGRRLGVDAQRPRRWRRRWNDAACQLLEAEAQAAQTRDLRELITNVLSDAERSGSPPKFTPEQVAQLISLACESPQDSGIPVTHWTPDELAKEAMKRGIVESISGRHLDRLLKRGGSSPAQKPVLDDVS